MKVEVTRYRKADGYATRNWAVVVNGELLAVTVYRKGAEAVARTIDGLNGARPVVTLDGQGDAAPGKVTRPEA
ncbi:MAG: hypothetical protein NTW21_29460 [Verrucomicrobia bacterium]|nr:hypothetical protein [Verrucomicrobiota bacterium]